MLLTIQVNSELAVGNLQIKNIKEYHIVEMDIGEGQRISVNFELINTSVQNGATMEFYQFLSSNLNEKFQIIVRLY